MSGISNTYEEDVPTPAEQDAIRSIAKPFHAKSDDELRGLAGEFLRNAELDESLLVIFEKGAMLAQQPTRYEQRGDGLDLTETEARTLRDEKENKWNISGTLLSLVIVCSMSAAVQGMDETAVNGAQLFYSKSFGIEDGEHLLGLLNAAPYLSCAVLGCWLTEPMNKYFGRRGTIFIACIISSLSCLWQGFTHTWQHMFFARLVLGLGIGPKSATVPIYAAESSPASIRGALTMMWQMWVAFGVMVGYLAGVAFHDIHSEKIPGLNWRLMIASPMVPPLIVCVHIFFCPESPRWLISHKRFKSAFEALESLRGTKLQAARDLLHIHFSLEAEKKVRRRIGVIQRRKELLTVPRNWRALRASTIVMAMQQLGGVNVIVYYSCNIIVEAGASTKKALLLSMGFGIINFLFALPAVWTIDTFGMAFYIPDGNAKTAVVSLGIFLFGMAYSPGEGPVPFVYSAECYPLHLRDIGMSWSTSVTWFFNFLVAMTLPLCLKHMGQQGTFGYYAGWNVIGFFLIFMYVPETKGKTLEGLDKVFRRRSSGENWKSLKALFFRGQVRSGIVDEVEPEQTKNPYLM
ncbi:uncharacterized protein H6S33_001484 [Morchella sextelata]|uniref:uncharacterized protein n=1 Tax=Morchella sextelata TaxID=1174677 RepID=UPI001D03AE90|nr:uncharacterized protein H6S33_001484 [Morchella sextelata]KAH0608350.1 hypothetical protein H6S33_001484 [Morchella sextelata]